MELWRSLVEVAELLKGAVRNHRVAGQGDNLAEGSALKRCPAEYSRPVKVSV